MRATSIKNEVGQRLLELRKEKGLKQEEVAQAVGITRASLSYYEKGERSVDIEVLYKLCQFYNISIDYLFGLSKVKTPDMDIKAIAAKTGLSENAINFLIEENSKKNIVGKMSLLNYFITYDADGNPYTDLLNYLLRRGKDTIPLLDYMYQYIFRSDFKYCIDNNDCLHTSVKLTDQKKQSWTSYNVSQFHNMLLLNINSCLSNIRKKHLEGNNKND